MYEPHYLYRNILFVSPRTVNFVNYPNKPGEARTELIAGECRPAAADVETVIYFRGDVTDVLQIPFLYIDE